MAEVHYHHVTKQFVAKGSQVTAVNDLCLTVDEGEFLVLVGPSGCGKTTALRMLAGLEDATAGDIVIGDRRVNDVPPKDRDIAMVFQNYALYPHMNVYDNMAFGLKMRRVPSSEIDRLIKDAAEMLDISGLLKRKPKELSGGQRQRVALGRAIVRHPQVFLMDEPLSNLDAKLRVQTRAELIKLHQRLRTTTIYVTHDQTEAMTMGNRIAVMKDGVLQQLDTPQRLYDSPANLFVAGFIGSPAMNLLQARIVDDRDGLLVDIGGEARLRVWEGHANVLRPYRREPVILGLRPEDITEAGPDSAWTLTAPVEVLEPLGSDLYVTFRLGNQTFTGRFDPRARPAVGYPETAAVNLARAHFFDPKTERAIV